jgi:hypothetical protein
MTSFTRSRDEDDAAGGTASALAPSLPQGGLDDALTNVFTFVSVADLAAVNAACPPWAAIAGACSRDLWRLHFAGKVARVRCSPRDGLPWGALNCNGDSNMDGTDEPGRTAVGTTADTDARIRAFEEEPDEGLTLFERAGNRGRSQCVIDQILLYVRRGRKRETCVSLLYDDVAMMSEHGVCCHPPTQPLPHTHSHTLHTQSPHTLSSLNTLTPSPTHPLTPSPPHPLAPSLQVRRASH